MFSKIRRLLCNATYAFSQRNDPGNRQRKIQYKLHTRAEGGFSQLDKLKGLLIVQHPKYVGRLPSEDQYPSPKIQKVHQPKYGDQCQESKFRKVFGHLIRDRVINVAGQVTSLPQMDREIACSIRREEYLNNAFKGTMSIQEQISSGYLWTPEFMGSVGRYETGGNSTLSTAHLALKQGLAFGTAGGTHHAYPNHGYYSLLNDLTLTAHHLIKKKKVQKILILDFDMHQNDETTYILSHIPAEIILSMQCSKKFAFGTKVGNLDLFLEPGTKNSEFMSILADCLPMVLDTFHPELVFYNAGVKTYKNGLIGNLSLTERGLLERDNYILSTILVKGIACATIIDGYRSDVNLLAKPHSFVR